MKPNPEPAISRCIETLTRCCERVDDLRIERALIDEDMNIHYGRIEIAMNDLRDAIRSAKPAPVPLVIDVHVHGLDEVTL